MQDVCTSDLAYFTISGLNSMTGTDSAWSMSICKANTHLHHTTCVISHIFRSAENIS